MQVEESDIFERDGFNIHSNATISFTQAILGGETRIPGISGPIMLKVNSFLSFYIWTNAQFTFQVPAGVQSHHKIKLADRGIPRLNGYGNGDHFVHIKIRIPK